MNREEYLEQIARDLFEAANEEQVAKTKRSKLRKEFCRLYDEGFKGRSFMLPIKTIEVPDSFFDKTKMSKAEFAQTRFPGWNVEHCEYNTADKVTVFVFKRDPTYVAGVVDVPDGDGIIRVSKIVSESTPEIDFNTLKKERPDLYKRLAKRRMVIELNDDELEELANNEPHELAVLERHMQVKEPVVKAAPKRVDKDGKVIRNKG